MKFLQHKLQICIFIIFAVVLFGCQQTQRQPSYNNFLQNDLNSTKTANKISGNDSDSESDNDNLSNIQGGFGESLFSDDSSLDGGGLLDSRFNQKKEAKSKEYRLKSGDRIEVSVWGEDMTRQLLIQPDGRISYPLVGSIYVSGKTMSELVDIIETKLSEYIYDPKVTVIGKSFAGNFVSIVGAVQKPGRVLVGEGQRLLDVFTAAGGLRYSESTATDAGGAMANLSKAYYLRNNKLLPVDFEALFLDGDVTQNIKVEIGDYIFIPSSSTDGIYVTGEVKYPKVIPHRGRPNIVQIITEAGGSNKKGHLDSVAVVRGSLSHPKVQIVNVLAIMKGQSPNVYLQSGDIVHVPETFLSKSARIIDQIIPFF